MNLPDSVAKHDSVRRASSGTPRRACRERAAFRRCCHCSAAVAICARRGRVVCYRTVFRASVCARISIGQPLNTVLALPLSSLLTACTNRVHVILFANLKRSFEPCTFRKCMFSAVTELVASVLIMWPFTTSVFKRSFSSLLNRLNYTNIRRSRDPNNSAISLKLGAIPGY